MISIPSYNQAHSKAMRFFFFLNRFPSTLNPWARITCPHLSQILRLHLKRVQILRVKSLSHILKINSSPKYKVLCTEMASPTSLLEVLAL